MKYLRRQNLNPGSFLDDTVLQRADGNIELNPTQRVVINGDLEFGPGVAIPGPEVTNIMYVTLDGDDTNTGYGEGKNQAKRTLKSALATAQQGTTIYVRSGTYIEDNPLQVPPKVSIIGDNLRNTIIRPLNGTVSFGISNVVKVNEYVTITTSSNHGFDEGDRVRVKCSTVVAAEETDVNIYDVPTPNTFRYRQTGAGFASTAVTPGVTNKVLKGTDLFHVNSADYITGIVFKGVPAPAYCINIDRDAIVDTSPYIQNCSNINGPWLNNGEEWLPFVTEQPDITGTMVVGPRPLLDDELQTGQVSVYGINVEGAGGGMLIDGDRYSSESPIKSMVADAFTQVAQGGVGFHITNFGYMQLVSCFAVFCAKAFYTTRGGYLSISNSVIDFGEVGFLADGYYPDPYDQGQITSDYYSTVGSATVTGEGSGFSTPPSVLIDPPTIPGGVQATAVASIDPILGIINAITITDPGSGYDFQPSITITPANGASAIANLSKNQSIQVNYLSNKPQVGSVMFLGTDPTAYYVSSTSSASLPFKYDEQKCRRDVGIIVNAVLSDTVFNSNYQSVSAGLSYLRGYSSKVTSLQKAQTIAGLTEARIQTLALTSNVTAQNRITSNFNTVINIINLGVSVAPTVSMPATTVREPGFYEAAEILRLNRSFIQSEITAWLAVNYPALVGVYDVATSERDLGYVIDAMRYDLTYQGNSQTVNAAKAFLNGQVLGDEVEECLSAFVYLKTIIGNIVKNETIVKSAGNGAVQNISSPLGSPLDPEGPTAQSESLLEIIIDVIDYGVGYIPEVVTKPEYSFANDPTLVSERAIIIASISDIQEATIIYLNSTYGGSITVTMFPPVQNVEAGTEVQFHNVSTISTASTSLEYVGAGVTYNALPFFGGEPNPANERIELNGGRSFTVTSDQIGNYKIGEFFTVNALTGEVTIDAENINLQGLAAIGPFKRNGIPVGVQLREVSNNSNLISSLGVADVNTVPTQPAVQAYVENRYLNKVTTAAETVASSVVTYAGDLGINGGDIYSTATTFNLVNQDSTASITDDGPTTVNAFLNAGTINIAHTTSTTNINGNLVVKGSIVSSTQASVDLLDTATATINAFGAATAINIGAATGSFIVDNQTITFTNATTVNINGANPTLASTSTGTLTLFDTLITTVNAFRSATSVTLGEGSGTLTIQSASTVLNGDLQVKGGDVTTNQTTFNLLNTTATTVNAFGTATALNIGAGSGTTTVANNLKVNLDSTLGTDTTSANIFNGTLTANIRDNVSNSLEIKENTNSYFKIDTANSNELTSFGSIAKVAFSNVLDASSSTIASATFAGGVGIAKKLYVGTDLNVGANVTIGDDRTVDVHTVNGTLSINVPDNTAIAFQVTENTQTYLTAVTTNGSESVTIEATPKLLVKNITDSSTKDTGALIVEGGVGIEKNLTVGVDLKVDRDVTVTGDLSVNGGDLTTTAASFNLLNTTATTVNFAGAATTLEIGAATGTTNINNNLDVDGDVNIDGGDLTVSTATFNLANTTATTLNVGGAGTTFNLGTSAGAATTVNIGSSSNSGNTVEINSTAAGTINLTTDVTSGTVNQWQSVTGIINIGSTGTINLGTGTGAITTVDIGGAVTGNILKISGTAVGIANLTSDVTSGTVNVFADTTGTVNIGGQGSTINLGATGSNSILEIRGSSSSGTATVRTNSGVVTADVFNTVVTTGNLFGAGTTVSIGAATGTTTINNANTVVTGDLAVNGGDITTSATTFNLLNATVTTGNLFGAGTTISIGAATGTTTINNANTVVTGDLTVNGGDVTTSATTFNLLNTTATSVNFAGAATALEIGAATGLTRVKNNFEVDGDVTIDGGDLIVSTATFNLANTSATTVNFAGAATTLEIGAATGTTNINNNLDVDGDVNIDGGDLTVSTTTFNIANTTATTVNAFGAATSLVLSATTGTTNIRNNLDVDGDINLDGGDITTSAGTFNLANTTATTVNAFGAATAINIGFASPTGLTTVKHDLKVDGDLTVDGTLNLGNDVTIAGDLAINGGDLTTTAASFNLLNTTATTVNFAGASTAVSIGAATGTTTINNANTVVTGDLAVNGGDITSSAVTVNILAATSTTVNAFGAATALNLGAATGTTIVRNNFEVDLNTTLNGTLTVDLGATVTGDLAVNGGDITTSFATFNLVNANATTVNFAGAATTLEIGAATGTTNINNNLDVDGDVNIDGGDLTVSTSTFNLANTTATTVNAFGAATTILIGAGTGTTEVNNNLQVDLDLDVRGGDITTNQTTFNLINTTATTVNFAGAATTLEIGAATGTTNINNNLDVDGDVNIDGGDLTVSTATFNLANTTATTVNFAGAATTLEIGAATGTTNINNNLDVDGDVNIDGGDLTVSTTTFNLANTTATTGNLFGVATAVNVGISAASASTFTFGPAITGNIFKIRSTASGTVDLTSDVTSGIVSIVDNNSGTTNIANAGTINLGKSSSAITTVDIGGAITGNTFKISSTAAGLVTLTSDVTTGSVNLFNNITTGTVNVAGAGASIINLGSTTSTVNIGVLTLTTDLAVQYGGTGQSSFTTNGVIYGQNASGLAVTAASVPGSNATTSYGVLTTDVSNVPVWTDTIDGGSY
jgi:hypothetical protein